MTEPADNLSLPQGDRIASLYSRLETDRNPFLDRARVNAKLTIPSLMPEQGSDGTATFLTPYQSIGAHGVNTLTAKLVMTLLPANAPMFRFSVTDQVVAELAQDPTQRSGVEQKLNEIERAGQDEIEALAIRAALVEAIKHLIVCGNILLILPKKGNLKIFKLDRYVVQRDYEGNLLRVIVKETVAVEVLPAAVFEMLRAAGKLETNIEDESVKTKEVDIYTVYEREGNRMVTFQSIVGMVVPGSKGSWRHDKAPVMPLRWNYLSDEDYGRAYIDEYIGDLSAAESLSRAIREGTAASAKVNPMVNPTGLTRAQDVVNAENLEVISGRADDVTMLQFEKQADFNVASNVLQDIINRLSHAFMMNKSAQRNGDRVTAEEVKLMVSDLDDVLGGVYSLLAQELQLPLVSRVLDRMEREKKIPPISTLKTPDGKQTVTPKIVTGIEALGRGHDYNKYMTAARDVLIPFKQELQGEVNLKDFVQRALTSLSIDTKGIFFTDEQKAANAQQMQGQAQQQSMNEMLQSVVKGGAGPMAKVAAEQLAQAQPEAQG